MNPGFNKLWEPYSKKMTLTKVIEWLRTQCPRLKVPQETVEIVISETMLELANGKEFPTDGCQCGCELKNPHSAINHYMLAKLIEVGEEIGRKHEAVLEEAHNSRLAEVIQGLVRKEVEKSQEVAELSNQPKPGRLKRAWRFLNKGRWCY